LFVVIVASGLAFVGCEHQMLDDPITIDLLHWCFTFVNNVTCIYAKISRVILRAGSANHTGNKQKSLFKSYTVVNTYEDNNWAFVVINACLLKIMTKN
jgi:hypothetical protein